MSIKGCSAFFLFSLDLELFAKIKKEHDVHTLTGLSITQDLNKIKKNPSRILEALVNGKRVQNFSKKY